MPGQIQEVYAELGRVLNRPEAFALGSRAPQPLADRLRPLAGCLQRALRERQMPPDEDLEIELAQDADRDL